MVATIGAPCDPEHVRHLFTSAETTLETEGQAEVAIAGRKFLIKKQFIDDISEQAMQTRIASLGKALMVFHAPMDKIVGIENARRIYEAARHPKNFLALDGADHLLGRAEDARYVASMLATWASRYLEADSPVQDVEVRGRGDSLVQQVRTGRHTLVADEPAELGGADLGPNPYDFLLAALGTCTSMTLQLYAARKKWPVDSIHVSLKHGRIYAKDCEDCESKDGLVDEITREITIKGALEPEQQARLSYIADRCPVHRTLQTETKIRTKFL